MTYEELLREADSHSLIVREKSIPGYSGRIYRNRIAIHDGIQTDKEKACILAEELGHHFTTYGDIIEQDSVIDQKQEQRARLWAYNKQIGLIGIIQSFEHGCQSKYEMAEYLDVTEDFLEDAIKKYRQKYGMFTTLDNYVIYFEPCLGVIKMK